jgi:hypothetical protein
MAIALPRGSFGRVALAAEVTGRPQYLAQPFLGLTGNSSGFLEPPLHPLELFQVTLNLGVFHWI